MPNVVNSLEFNKKLSEQLDKKLVQEAVTGFLVDNAMRLKFVGTQTVMIPDVEMTGMGNYDRQAGFAKGAITIQNTPFQLRMDRSITFTLDDQDMDETGVAETMAGYMRTFVEEHSAPEVDAYTLSMLASLAIEKGNTVTGDPATQAYKMFNEAQIKAQKKAGYRKELVAFVDSVFYAALMSSPEITRQAVVSNFKHGEINLEVKKVNNTYIIPVDDDRMMTAYDFLPGSVDGETPGGFEPMENAMNIGLLIMPKNAASLIKKTEKTRIFDPAHNLNADAWKGDYRLYYDVVIKKSRENTIIAYVYGAVNN